MKHNQLYNRVQHFLDRISVFKIWPFTFALVFLQLAPCEVKAQNIPDLAVQIVQGPPGNVKIGSTIGVSVTVFNIGSASVASTENVIVTVELRDPNGNLVTKSDGTPSRYIQALGGLAVGGEVNLNNGTVLLQVPWSEGSKWTPNASWQIVASVQAAALETNIQNNEQTQLISLDLPNLVVSGASIAGSLEPGSDLILTATFANTGNVRTQEGIFFGATARLNIGGGEIEVDSETLILPRLTTDDGLPTVYIDSGDDVTITFPPLRIPVDAAGDMNVTIEVDSGNPDVVHETNENDNTLTLSRTVQAQTFILQVDPDSFIGDIGVFSGMDPVRFAFSVRNEGTRELRTGDDFVIRTILSENDQFDPNDMILREFSIRGGTGLGGDLRPNENLYFDWIQQLPDNFEGDYYVLVNVENSAGQSQTFFAENTPTISIESSNKTNVEQLIEGEPQQTERPAISGDGRYVAFEQLDTNGIQQIWFQDTKLDTPPVLITEALGGTGLGNGHSLRPQISDNGLVVTFHSFASNLVAGDQNDHADVFLYRVLTQQLIRAYNTFTNEDGNGGSFYPRIDGNGSKVVFESKANNLDYNGITTTSKQIFMWDTTIGTFGRIYAITFGNNESRHPAIDRDGKTVVFESDASKFKDLANTRIDPSEPFADLPTPDVNNQTDVFALDLESNETWYLSVNEFGEQGDGPSTHPVISGDGKVVAYQSSSSNFVRDSGISVVTVENGGVGYHGNPQITVYDRQGIGSGAVLTLNGGINQYGQILPDGIRILNSGSNYIDPQVRVIQDPNEAPPVQLAQIKAHLSHPMGEIYRIELGAPNDHSTIGASLARVSENMAGVGGNARSREATINYDGSLIAYSTKSSNLQDTNITRADGGVFYNQPNILAEARAIIVGPIGEIEVGSRGIGYQNGFLEIDDLSGSGSGAIADYEVDSLGRIASINITDPGENYNLEETVVSVRDARGGVGFSASAIRFPFDSGVGEGRSGGGKVFRVEMLQHGMGYKNVVDSTNGLDSIIQIQGDGIDTDGNGMPDAKIDPNAIRINADGGVYLVQKFYFEILSTTSLPGTTLVLEDANDSLTIQFSFNDAGAGATTVQIGTPGNLLPLSDIRTRVADVINAHWNNPTNLMEGPVIELGFGNDFTLSALTGRFTYDNPTSVRIDQLSNMLFSGEGFTRATPVITPPPVIHGFSEVLSGTNLTSGISNQLFLDNVTDDLSDDVYLFDYNTSSNKRVSLSNYGYPFNFLSETQITNTPNSRFPAISSDGRHLVYSTDGVGLGGLVNGVSNQLLPPGLQQNDREVVRVDLKKNVNSKIDIDINMLYPSDAATFTFGTNSRIPVIAQIDYDDDDIARVVLLVDNQPAGGSFFTAELSHFEGAFSTGRWTGTFNTGFPGSHVYQVVALNANDEPLGSSIPRTIVVQEFDSLPPRVNYHDPGFQSMTTFSKMKISAFGSDDDGTLVGVQFYMDGEPLGEEILRRRGVPQDFATFPVQINYPKVGVHSIFAIGRDDNDNHVSTDIFNISVTPGSTPPAIELSHGPESFQFSNILLTSDVINLSFDPTNGEFLHSGDATNEIDITLKEPVGKFLNTKPRVKINHPTGSGASLEAVIGEDRFGKDYGKLLGFKLISTGQNYQLEDVTILVHELELALGDDGSIQSLIPFEAIGEDFLAPPRIEILSQGNSAVIEPIVESNTSSSNFGKITGFSIANGGANYSQDFSILVIPVIRNIGYGEPGEFRFGQVDFDQGGIGPIYEIGLRRAGYGYAVSPVLEFQHPNGHWRPYITFTPDIDTSRIALTDNNQTTSSLSEYDNGRIDGRPIFPFKNDIVFPIDRLRLKGGFTQAPINFEFETLESFEPIRNVRFVVNGQVQETKVSPPYSFSYITDEPGDYDAYAVVTDMTGNTIMSETTDFSITRYESSGTYVKLGTENFIEMPADSKTLLAAAASSDAGIAEVEFFINGSSKGKVVGDGYTEAFIKEVDLRGLPQGRHQLSVIARDFLGNEAGTFSSGLTSIQTRQNTTLQINPKLISSQAPNINLIYPEDQMMVTSSSEIYLFAEANDTDGRLVGVQFYVNGNKFGDEIFFDSSQSQASYPYGIKWSPNDPRNDPDWDGISRPRFGPGVYVINAVATDTSRNKTLSNAVTITSTTGDVNTVPVVNMQILDRTYESGETVFLSAEVSDLSDDLNGGTNRGVIESVQFFANGRPIQVGEAPDGSNLFRITQSPYFTPWNPPGDGSYKVYAMARDNEGNYALSEIQHTSVNTVDEFSQQPVIGSLFPTTSGQVDYVTVVQKSGRRTQDDSGIYTLITGVASNYLDELIVGENVRFQQDNKTSNAYKIAYINNNGSFEIEGSLHPDDLEMLSSPAELQIVPVYRAGSRIPIHLEPGIADTDFDSTIFYMDGIPIASDNRWPFSAIFVPVYEGNYTLSVVAQNVLQNQTLYSERISVSPAVGLAPDGATQILPTVQSVLNPDDTGRGPSVTIGSELMMVAGFDDLDAEGIDRVEFYHNGKLELVDREAPYYFRFKPTTSASIDLVDRGWEVTAVGIDADGNRIALRQQGNVQGSEVLPRAVIKSPSDQEVFTNNQSIEIRVDIQGTGLHKVVGARSEVVGAQSDDTVDPTLERTIPLYANGEYIANAFETNPNSGIFIGEWICDSAYTGASGKIDIFGAFVMDSIGVNDLSFTPTVMSNIATIYVEEPNMAGDPVSAVNQTFTDLLRYNPTEQQLKNAVSQEMFNGDYLFNNKEYLDWASKISERDLFQNMVDAIAGYHIMVGLWPETSRVNEIVSTYAAAPNYGSDGSPDNDGDGYSFNQENFSRPRTSDDDPSAYPSSAFNVSTFVDNTLSSATYTDVHGPVPPLLGNNRFIDYAKNRQNFYETLHINKYGSPPTTLQKIQGSTRIATFDPNSPEAKAAARKEQMEELAMYSRFGYSVIGGGGGGGRGNNNQNPFGSLLGGLFGVNTTQAQQTLDEFENPGGEPAVLFVTNMIAENKISNLDMISNTQPKRDYYRTAALIVAYWQENLDVLSDELISSFHGMSDEQMISALMKDRKYYSRFGGYSITRHAEEASNAPGWKWLDWLGDFNDDTFPWVYHLGLGWIYIHGPTDEQTWFYIPNAGWLGTTEEIWKDMDDRSSYLWLYEQSSGRWVAYILESPGKTINGLPSGKRFWNPDLERVFAY